MKRDMELLRGNKKARDLVAGIRRDLDGNTRAHAWATIRRAAHQVGEIAARHETGQYSTAMSLLILVHHGDAVGPDVDPMRPLSSMGRAATDRIAAAAASRGVKPDAIWHSGKLRARQTAEIFWKACNPLAPLTAERGLLPGDPSQWIRDRLIGEGRTILIVGHMPYLPRLLQMLTGARDERAVSFPLHGCVALETDGDQWKEIWRLES
jgi:phosphohistidine phosphatase